MTAVSDQRADACTGFMQNTRAYVLAFDTSNEVIAIGVGRLDGVSRTIECVASYEEAAKRASNTRLIPCIDDLLARIGVARSEIACVVCGRGPGSFTGVRIAMATAKGIAQALPGCGPVEGGACGGVRGGARGGVPLVGVSSLDAVAWNVWDQGVRGSVLVAADAMRHEVYPVRYSVGDAGPVRLQSDTVVRAEAAAESLGETGDSLQITGDALAKYAELFAPHGNLLAAEVWAPTGRGLLLAAQAAWRADTIDPFDAQRHNPAFALPVYTRLSDAEENERIRLAEQDDCKDLRTGVQGGAEVGASADTGAGAEVGVGAGAGAFAEFEFKPLDKARVPEVTALEREFMGSNAWSESLLSVDLAQRNRTWWMCLAPAGSMGENRFALGKQGKSGKANVGAEALVLVGYAGGMIVDGEVEILKVAVVPAMRRRGIARALLAHVAEDARNLGASDISLEVRAGNTGAQALYTTLGMKPVGTRPRYYSDGEDALLMRGALDDVIRSLVLSQNENSANRGVAGMPVVEHTAATVGDVSRPLIFAIESSCDETAAAIIDGAGTLCADVVASQINFHARFGGVVPEIASRKHIEAICGVCDECFDVAAAHMQVAHVGWQDVDAVAVTYAPGLVGALVVGVAFAKGAAWAAEKPFIGVNHLEGHLYANKLGSLVGSSRTSESLGAIQSRSSRVLSGANNASFENSSACKDGLHSFETAFQPPAVVSLVSGGNTMLVHMRDWGDYVTLGTTIDDAVGEAFDKVAKALGLGYPGGPVISRLAKQGDPQAIAFPRAMLHSGDLRFSLSGLKTAVITYINQEREAGRELDMPDIAASFQQAVIDVQVAKAKTALQETGATTFCLGGGVAANPALRAAYEQMCRQLGVRLFMPPLSSCGDNAGMVALVALDRYRAGRFFSLDADAYAHANLDEPY